MPSANSRLDNGDQVSERTPLLDREGGSGSQHGSDHSSEHSGGGGSNDGSSASSAHTVSDLGDFTLQPGLLAKAVAEKDISLVLSEIKNDGDSDDPGKKICEALQTDPKKGLEQDQVSEDGRGERERVYGKNKLPEKQLKSFWRFLWDAFCDKVLVILTVAAAVSFALGMWQDFGPQHDPNEPRVNWVEGVAIMTAIVIVTVTSSVNDYSKERQFKALSDTKEIPTVKVIRDGKKYKTIKSTELLVGDLVQLEAGDILTCDGLILSMQHDIKVDESDATGESDAISKATVEGASGAPPKASSDKTKADKTGSDAGQAKGDHQDKKQKKQKKGDPILLSGSKVLEGDGQFLVIAVGTSSFQGKIFMSLRSSQPDQTRMQKQLAALAEKIAKIASLAGGLLFLCLFVRNCIDLKTKPDRTPAEKGQGFLQAFVIAVTLVVVAVPEGLPLAVTLALAFATNRMTQHNLLVRVFEACETMSNANVVVTDKTGTLTANEMRVVEGSFGGSAFSLRDPQETKKQKTSDADPTTEDADADEASDGDLEQETPVGQGENEQIKHKEDLVELLKKNDKFAKILAESIAINSTAFQEDQEHDSKGQGRGKSQDGKQDKTKSKKSGSKQKAGQANGNRQDNDTDSGSQEPQFVGNKTETALLRMLELDLADLDKPSYSELRDKADRVLMLPFSSSRKAMATAVKLPDDEGKEGGGKYRLYVKGAAEVIVGLCSKHAKVDSSNGEATDIDQDKVQTLVESYAKRSLRTIALAYRDFEEWPPTGAEKPGDDENDQENAEGDTKVKYEDIAKELTLVAIPGIEDPLRQGVKKAVEKCRTAGVNVKMCTGDNIMTAKAIAKQCGIYDGGEVISGKDWRELSDEEKREKASGLQVMARSLPEDKETLVQALKDVGKIVGVTGDGTNDALALKKGDVGFSMGQAGTEVAKEASDVIIMDDNFTSLVGAITWGRCVSDAVRKFLQFQLAVNVTAIVITFVSSVSGSDENSVMNAVQLLWVNLIMDTFAALALATDPADDSLLQRQPESRQSPIISVPMTKMIIAQAAYQIAVTLTLHFSGPRILRPISKAGDVPQIEFNTLVFNVFVWCQIFNMINCRQLKNNFNVFVGLHRNLWLLGILAIMIGGQVLIVFFGGAAFDTKPIPPAYWGLSIALGAGSLVVGFLVRLIPDAPLGQALIRLGIMPNLDELPRTRPSDREDGKPFDFIRKLRGGRQRANSNLYKLLHPTETKIGKKVKKDIQNFF